MHVRTKTAMFAAVGATAAVLTGCSLSNSSSTGNPYPSVTVLSTVHLTGADGVIERVAVVPRETVTIDCVNTSHSMYKVTDPGNNTGYVPTSAVSSVSETVSSQLPICG